MKLAAHLRLFALVALAKLSRRIAGESDKKKLCCEYCHAAIHRHDKYTVVSARHKDCRDPKLVGQLPLERAPSELIPVKVPSGETVHMHYKTVMGSEFIDPYQNGEQRP